MDSMHQRPCTVLLVSRQPQRVISCCPGTLDQLWPGNQQNPVPSSELQPTPPTTVPEPHAWGSRAPSKFVLPYVSLLHTRTCVSCFSCNVPQFVYPALGFPLEFSLHLYTYSSNHSLIILYTKLSLFKLCGFCLLPGSKLI